MKCLDDEVKQIFWNQTMQYEKDILPDFAESEEGMQSLRQDAKLKFCSVDLDQVFQPFRLYGEFSRSFKCNVNVTMPSKVNNASKER